MSDICREDLRVRYPHADWFRQEKQRETDGSPKAAKISLVLNLTIMSSEALLTGSDLNTVTEFHRDGKKPQDWVSAAEQKNSERTSGESVV